MPIDNTQTGISSFFDLKKNDPVQPDYTKDPIANIKRLKENNFQVTKPKINPISLTGDQFLASTNPNLASIYQNINYLDDLKRLPYKDIALKYSNLAGTYKEDFESLYDYNP